MSQRSRAYELYEQAIESVHDDIDTARELIEKLQMEMYNVDLNDSDYELLDSLLTKALVALDRVGQ